MARPWCSRDLIARKFSPAIKRCLGEFALEVTA